MSLTLTPIYTENFTPDSNPLNPAEWSVPNGLLAMQALSGLGCSSANNTFCAADFIGSAVPNDCYLFATIGAWNQANGSIELDLILRDSADNSNYTNASIFYDGVSSTTLDLLVSFGSNDIETLYTTPISPKAGDTFQLVVIGNAVGMWYNGVLLHSTVDSNILASGSSDIDVVTAGAATDAGFSQVVIGSASGTIPGLSYNVPDCRTTKPNSATSEAVNGTLIYDVQTSSNPSIPPTDSRASKPVACGKYPQNSRTPGTYGPGE